MPLRHPIHFRQWLNNTLSLSIYKIPPGAAGAPIEANYYSAGPFAEDTWNRSDALCSSKGVRSLVPTGLATASGHRWNIA